MTKQEAKQAIADCMRNLYHRDMLNLFEGNVSMRYGDIFLISPSQTDKETMTADMILELDAQGNVLNPECGKKPSSEYKMHLQAYEVCPWINAAIHDHSAYATAFAMANKPIESDGLAEALEIFETVPVVPYGRPGTPEIAAGFKKYLPDYSVVLLANHGLFASAPTLELAFAEALAVEKMAKAIVVSNLLGGAKALPEQEVKDLKTIAVKRREYIKAMAMAAAAKKN